MPLSGLHHLRVGSGMQGVDDGEDLFRPAPMDEVDRPFVVEHRMQGVEPKPRLVGRVEVGKPVHDVTELGDHRLRAQIGGRLAAGPTGHRGRRDGDDVGDVLALEPCPL